MIKGIAVLGATGSIGRQALDIIYNHPDKYKSVVLAAGRRVDDLIELARVHRPALAVIADETLLPALREALAPLGIATAAGASALADCVDLPEVDMVLTATVGYSGLAPTVRAIKAHKDIALANKETLVVAGQLVNTLLSESGTRLFPVDSEHSAIAQCLVGEKPIQSSVCSSQPQADLSVHGLPSVWHRQPPPTLSSIRTGVWVRKSR